MLCREVVAQFQLGIGIAKWALLVSSADFLSGYKGIVKDEMDAP